MSSFSLLLRSHPVAWGRLLLNLENSHRNTDHLFQLSWSCLPACMSGPESTQIILCEAWVNGLVAVGSLQYKCTSHYGTQKGRRRQGKKVAVLELAPLCLHKYFKDHSICISCLEDKPKDLIRAWGKRVDQQSTLQSTLCPQYPSVMLGRVRDSVISNSLFLFLLSKWLSFQGGLLMTQILETKFEGLDFQYSDGIQLWSVQLR